MTEKDEPAPLTLLAVTSAFVPLFVTLLLFYFFDDVLDTPGIYLRLCVGCRFFAYLSIADMNVAGSHSGIRLVSSMVLALQLYSTEVKLYISAGIGPCSGISSL